jgi:hypothetical protein
MRASPRDLATRRVAISLIAIFALLLNGLVATYATTLPPSDPTICVQVDGGAQDEPSGEHGPAHNYCCVLACVVCGVAYVASVAGVLVFPERSGARIALSRATPIPTSRPLELYFSARGPPTLA